MQDRAVEPATPERFVALDIHKHYMLAVGVNAQREEVLSARRIEWADFRRDGMTLLRVINIRYGRGWLVCTAPAATNPIRKHMRERRGVNAPPPACDTPLAPATASGNRVGCNKVTLYSDTEIAAKSS
jgi:hypothetical protein